MDSNQKALIELLSLSLHGKRASAGLIQPADWPSVYLLAQVHSVLPLVYSALNYGLDETKVNPELKKSVYKSAVRQIQNLNVFGKVIDRFDQTGITMIALKGLVLRQLYPYPDTRTMSDFDILVKENDFETAVRILQEMGFKPAGIGRDVHVEMTYDGSLLIELHKRLFEEDLIKLPRGFSDELWKNAVPVTICDRSVLTFSDDDTILYLCLHMAKHYEEEGFGLRQLCDIVVFVNAKLDMVDWNRFYMRTAELNISRHVAMIFSVCGCLFGMQIPDFPLWMECPGEEKLRLFIDDILEGGTFGMSTSKRHAGNRVINKVGTREYNGLGKLLGIIRFLLPTPGRLGEKYAYAKRLPVLLPAAWIHRWAYNVINRDQREMIKSLITERNKRDLSNTMQKRRELIEWLKTENRY